MSQELDYSCFKYRLINKRLLDSLVRSVLYFPHHAQLNDPFDCAVDIRRAIDRAIAGGICERPELLKKFRSDEGDIDRFRANVAKLGIGAFSLTQAETLLWSHYSDDHRGVALRYDFPYDYLTGEDRFFGVSRVSYNPNAISVWLSENIGLYEEDHFQLISELLKNALTSKAPAWRYEQEARLITPETGELEIPRKILTHVIFGLQTSREDEALVRSLVEKYYHGVRFGRVVRTEEDFGIAAIEA
jgi:hypothetical protein